MLLVMHHKPIVTSVKVASGTAMMLIGRNIDGRRLVINDSHQCEGNLDHARVKYGVSTQLAHRGFYIEIISFMPSVSVWLSFIPELFYGNTNS